MLADFQSRINVEAEYQRGKVWSQAQQALLIDSVMRGFDIPKIFLRKLPDGSPYLFDVIDGKQRLTAIWRFVSDDLRLLRNIGPLPDFGDLGGKCWSELPEDAKDRLQFANVTVSKIEEATSDEISELFLRLQRGEPLNAAERRNAMAGPVRDFVADHLATHSLWEQTGLSSARFGLHEHSAIVLALVLKGGPTALKGADLHRLYELSDFDQGGQIANRTVRLLDQLREVATLERGAIRTRWGLVDLSIALLRLQSNPSPPAPRVIMDFFMEFEQRRRSVGAQLADLQTKLVQLSVDDAPPPEEIELSKIPSDMLTYYLAFAREGATEENIATRSEILYQRFLKYWNSLQ